MCYMLNLLHYLFMLNVAFVAGVCIYLLFLVITKPFIHLVIKNYKLKMLLFETLQIQNLHSNRPFN